MNFSNWDKLPVKHKVGAFVFIVALVIYLLYDVVLSPQWARMDELTAQQNTELQKVKLVEGFVLAHPNPEQYLLELDNKMMQLDKAFPENPEMSSFLVESQQLAQEGGVQLGYLKAGNIDNKTGYQQLDVELAITGDYLHIMDFLNRLENGSRFINVTTIAMQVGKDGLTSKLSAKIYSHKAPAVAAPANATPPEPKK